jgi:hypothetical protein
LPCWLCRENSSRGGCLSEADAPRIVVTLFAWER